ncbi:unnamed protein product [Discula destructiva]
MPVSVQVSQVEAEEYFTEAVGTLTWWANQTVLADAAAALPDDDRFHTDPFAPEEVQHLVRNLTPALFNAVGVSVFVYPYERYKKKCFAVRGPGPEGIETASRAFAARTWSTRAAFEARFPNSTVLTWEVPPKAKEGWAADCVRNSFAHAQSVFVQRGVDVQVSLLEIWNSKSGEKEMADFHLLMEPREFLVLVKDWTDAFVQNATELKYVQPMQKLLTQLL